jgi:hypothetical protein
VCESLSLTGGGGCAVYDIIRGGNKTKNKNQETGKK